MTDADFSGNTAPGGAVSTPEENKGQHLVTNVSKHNFLDMSRYFLEIVRN